MRTKLIITGSVLALSVATLWAYWKPIFHCNFQQGYAGVLLTSKYKFRSLTFRWFDGMYLDANRVWRPFLIERDGTVRPGRRTIPRVSWVGYEIMNMMDFNAGGLKATSWTNPPAKN